MARMNNRPICQDKTQRRRKASGKLLAMRKFHHSWRAGAHDPHRAGITLLELLIVLTVAAVVLFIAWPTLQPTAEEREIRFAKKYLAYLHEQQQAYFSNKGTYAPLSVLATDEQVGASYDQRFAYDESVVEGVVFRGPTTETKIYDIVAEMANGLKYRVDQTGTIAPMQ